MIGIFGGTFDPVHYGHLKTVLFVQQQLGLQQIRLIPLGQAVHREQPAATASQRLEMLYAATADYPQLVIDDREIKRPGGSYTVDTLSSIKQELPDEALCLIIGSDAFAHFLDWHKPETIMTLAHIIVMQRPDSQPLTNPAIQKLLDQRQITSAEQLKESVAGKILPIQVPQLDISSTGIRDRLQSDLTISHLLPLPVYELITHWKLYKKSSEEPD